jgi:hypothetical protein
MGTPYRSIGRAVGAARAAKRVSRRNPGFDRKPERAERWLAEADLLGARRAGPA